MVVGLVVLFAALTEASSVCILAALPVALSSQYTSGRVPAAYQCFCLEQGLQSVQTCASPSSGACAPRPPHLRSLPSSPDSLLSCPGPIESALSA